jgi:HlyD family secretion protein
MDTKIESNKDLHLPVPNGALTRFALVIKGRLKVLGVIALLALGGAVAYVWWTKGNGVTEYVTEKVGRGDLELDVTATGTVQAVTTVQVGSQVSGTVAWLGADFKSRVTRGEVIARLDPALFQAQVATAQANLANAEAGVQAALTDINNQKANVVAAQANDLANRAQRDDAIALAKRNEQLRGIIPDRDIESSENQAKVAAARYEQSTSQINQAQAQVRMAEARLKQAQAEVQQAQAQLTQASVNLQHATVASPIDGVVVSRNVDVGQTVAASLQAPTLFTIANDLKSMQVLASIDEADVGQIHEGGKASFTVDAYPSETFSGEITQIRLNAQTAQNVVTYTAVMNVSNPDEKLMPGMTANVTVQVDRRENVLRVPNAALRFKPELSDQQQQELQQQLDARRQSRQAQGQTNGNSQGAPKQTRNDNATPGQGQSNSGQGQQAGESDTTRPRQGQTVWLLTADKKLQPRLVRTGLTDGRYTEIVSGNVNEGDLVITSQTGGTAASANSNRSQTSSPFNQRPAGGGRRIR